MCFTRDKKVEHIGAVKGAVTNDHAGLHETDRRAEAVWRYGLCVASVRNVPELQEAGMDPKHEPQENIGRLKALATNTEKGIAASSGGAAVDAIRHIAIEWLVAAPRSVPLLSGDASFRPMWKRPQRDETWIEEIGPPVEERFFTQNATPQKACECAQCERAQYI